MENFSTLITEPNVNQKSDTNEVVGVLLASSLLAFACGPIVKTVGTGLTSFFNSLFNKDSKDKDSRDKNSTDIDSRNNKNSTDIDSRDNYSKDNDSEDNDSEASENFNYLLMMSKEANQKEKDKNTQKKNDSLIKLLTACSFDKDGNEIPLEDRINKMKDTMTDEQFESFKKDMTDAYEKNKDDQNFKDALIKAKANIKPEDYDKMLDEAKKEAKSTLEQLDKEKKEIEDYEKKLAELDEKVNGSENDDEKKSLEEEKNKLLQDPPKTMTEDVTGVSASPTAAAAQTSEDPKEDPKKSEEYSNEEIEKMQDELSDLDPEKDKDKIKEKNDLLKSIAKAKGKSEDEYQVKAESDSEGRPLQRKTGPRGGKYYRVKVDGSWGVWQSDTNESLKNYLLRLLND